MADIFSDDQVVVCTAAFQKFDPTRIGSIPSKDVGSALNELTMDGYFYLIDTPETILEKFLTENSDDQEDRVDFGQFLTLVGQFVRSADEQCTQSLEPVWAMFERVDTAKSGRISVAQVKEAMLAETAGDGGESMSEGEWRETLLTIEPLKDPVDGLVDYKELAKKLMEV